MAVADQGVERGGAISAFCISHKQPILLADGAGADGVFYQVVVDLHAAIPQIDGEFFPLIEGVADGFSTGELGQAT